MVAPEASATLTVISIFSCYDLDFYIKIINLQCNPGQVCLPSIGNIWNFVDLTFQNSTFPNPKVFP